MEKEFDLIVDGLAEQGYAVVDHFLSKQEVQDILRTEEFQKGTEAFKKAGSGKNEGLQINEAVRGDYIQWLDKNTASAPGCVYLDKLHDLIQYVNRTLFLSLKDYEVHMTIY